MKEPKLTVLQRLLRARDAGKGIRLSPDDVEDLMKDGANQQRAEMDDLNDEGTPDDDIY